MRGLLVIDMQEITTGKKRKWFFKYDVKNLLNHINDKIASYDPDYVFYIYQGSNQIVKDLKGFLEKKPLYRLNENLKVVSKHHFPKSKKDVFSNLELIAILKEKDIKEIELVGVDGGACIADTALGAHEHGFKVILDPNGIGTILKKKAKKKAKILEKKGITGLLL